MRLREGVSLLSGDDEDCGDFCFVGGGVVRKSASFRRSLETAS